MQLAMIGMGRMGSSMVRRLMKSGHQCVVYDVHSEPVLVLKKEGATAARSIDDLIRRLAAPRVVWMMLPAAIVDQELATLARLLSPRDIVIDGGNSHYLNDLRRAAALKPLGIHYVDVGKRPTMRDAETTPLRHPEEYQYSLNLVDITEVWRRGSVICSWLLDLTASSLLASPDLADYSGRVSDSGEGRWTIAAGIDEAIPTPVLSAALYERFNSRGEAEFADKLLSAMRHGFGGHLEVGAAHEKGPDG